MFIPSCSEISFISDIFIGVSSFFFIDFLGIFLGVSSFLFIDFLGEERIEKILNEILEKNYYYDVSANGDLYDRESEFNFSFEIDDFSINVVEKNICVTCVVDYPGATITTNGNELEILDIYDDHETTTDDIQKIDDELESIMVEFIYNDLKVWERTGLSVEVEIINNL